MNNRFGIFLAALFVITLAACGGDETSGPDGNAKTLSAKVNGRTLDLTSVSWGYNTVDFFVSGGTDIFPPRETVEVSIDDITAPGTYQFGGGNSGKATGEYTPTGSNIAYTTAGGPVAGQVVVTEIDTAHAKGTFSFTARNPNNPNDSVVISEGSFNTKKF